MSKRFFTTSLLFLLLAIVDIKAQSPLKPRDPSIKGPQTFAILMGVSKYKYVRPLAYADKDAELFRDYLKSPGGGSVKDENIFLLLNDNASNANFWGKGFQWLRAKNLQKGDKLFIYLAGHGDAIDEDQFFFLGYDCNPEGDKNNYLVSGTIQLFNLKKKIANETAKGVEVLFIMDACRSNELPGGTAGQNFLNSAISEKRVGEIIMLATGAGQESLEDASIGNGHGLFTYYLVDGLSGVADSPTNPDNKISFQEIKNYVDKNVPSVAQQRFRRKQDPYFCCNENTDKVISNVDTAYLSKWLQSKKQQTRGGGNSFTGNYTPAIREFYTADTALVETYNRFYSAIKNKKWDGSASAEDYFQQLTKKYPGNPYTLDAKSTLAVEYINEAQARVDEYLSCTELSNRKKQENYQAGLRLEKAIAILREDDPDFANSLRGRMYLLKTNVENGTAFQNAYAALSIDRNGAYIQNKLALLHLENKQLDSAKYYAEKAVATAPKWNCALVTLGLVQKALNNTKNNKNQPKNPVRKSSFGYTLGGGLNQSSPTYSGNANTGFVGVESNTAATANLGFLYQVNLGNTISIRPTATVSVENNSIDFQRRPLTGGPIITETVKVNGTGVNIALPLIIRLTSKNIAPYIALGPSFSYLLSQNSSSSEILPVKKSLIFGNGGLGVDIGLLKSGLILSPELKYSAGFSDIKDNAPASSYAAAVSSLKKNAFSFSLYLRKR